MRQPLVGFEVRDDVIFSQSGHECPVIPHPHSILLMTRTLFIVLLKILNVY